MGPDTQLGRSATVLGAAPLGAAPPGPRTSQYETLCKSARSHPKQSGAREGRPTVFHGGPAGYCATRRPSTSRVTGEFFSNSSTKASSIRKKVSSQKLPARSQAAANET
jgi:hypothetical protein